MFDALSTKLEKVLKRPGKIKRKVKRLTLRENPSVNLTRTRSRVNGGWMPGLSAVEKMFWMVP